MEGDDGVHRSICCRRQLSLSADSRRSNGKPGSGSLTLVAFAALRNPVTT